MNNKILTLLQEGVSISFLETLTSDQINVLYERSKKSQKKETKEQAKPVETTVTSKVIKLPTGAKTAIGGATVTNDAGTTVITTTPTEGEVTEKAVSKQQQKLMGLALSVKKGDTPKSKVSKKVKDMAKEMSKKDLEDFASTKHKGLPNKKETKETVKGLEESIMKLIEGHLPPHTTKSELLNSIKRFKK